MSRNSHFQHLFLSWFFRENVQSHFMVQGNNHLTYYKVNNGTVENTERNTEPPSSACMMIFEMFLF